MRLALAAGGALLLALLTWLLLSGINTNASAFAETQRAFDDFALAEASIARDALEARSGLLGNYDVLAEAERAMESAAQRIRLHVEAQKLDPKPVEALTAAIGQYEDLIERFKRGNSLLQNSLSYVGQLSTDPAFGALGDQLAPSAAALAAAVLHLTRDSSAESAKSLQESINRFEAQAPTVGPEGEAAHALLAHARLLSDLLPEVDQTLRAVVAAPSRRPFAETRELLTRAQAVSEVTAQRFRGLLYAVSLGLLVIALRLGHRLWTRTLRIRRLVDANIIGIFIFAGKRGIVEANDAFLKIVGYDREDLMSGRLRRADLTPTECLDRDDRQSPPERELTGSSQPIEKEYIRKDGSRVPVLVGVATFEDGGNQGVAFVLDLTERGRAEEALRDSERKLRQFIESVPCHFWSANPDGVSTYLNRRLLDYFGIPRLEDQRPSDRFTVLHPDDAPETERALNHSFRTGESFQRVHRLRRADGEYRWHRVRAEPLRDHKGDIIQWYGFSIDIDEGKKAEDQLRRSEAYLAEAQRISHTGSWALSPAKANILYWSEECYRIWGFDSTQGLPERETVWRRIHSADRNRVLDEAEKALHQKKDYSIDFRIVLPDGTIRYVEAIGHHRFSEQGELIEVVGTNVDVTERKRAEEAIRESEYKLRQVIETVPSLIWSADPVGEPTQLNQRVFDYSGMRLEDFKHGGWEAFIHPDDFPETIRAFSHAIQTGTSYETMHRLRRADGEFRWHHARAEPLRDGEGRIIQWYGHAVDINEAKKAEHGLRRSQSYLAEAQRLSHTGTSVFDPTTMLYLYWSDECYRIWGLDPLRGLPSRETVWQRIHPDDRDRVWEGVQEALRQKKDYAGEFRIVLPDGTVKYLATSMQHLFSAGGEIVEVIGTHIDVTERKRAQEEHERLRQLESDLAHMNRLGIMGEQAASLAHEISQPIATARNNARAALNFLDRQPHNVGDVREALACIVGDADRAGEIIDRIRDHIRKAPPRKARFDFNHAIDEVIALGRSPITNNGVSIQTRLAKGLLPVHGDRVQLQQVLLNLVLNAVEAMSSVEAGPRELAINTEQTEGNGVLVTIRDSGPGIDPEHLERVFETFYTTKSSGVGMGLAICRTIIEAHGGRLWGGANEPRGAVFQFTLPGAAESS